MVYIIGGKHKKRKLLTPNTIRPTTSLMREAFFNMCQNYIEGATVLDLFAGSGAVGLEALSRGAKHVVFVEKNHTCCDAIQKNLSMLQEEKNALIIKDDVIKVLASLKEKFDIVYVDPPYGDGQAVLAELDKNPPLLECGTLFFEEFFLQTGELKNLVLKQKRCFGKSSLFIFYITDHA